MGRSKRIFGLGLLLVCVVAASTAGPASAETGGSFEFGATHATISGSGGGTHSFEYKSLGLGGAAMICKQASFTGTISGTTATELQLSPSYSECSTSGTETVLEITPNGCTYKLTIGKNPGGNNTFDLFCPEGKGLEIHHPNCTITVTSQTMTGAVYTEVIEGGRASLTVDLSFKLADVYHGGLCIFLGTSGHESEIKGSFTLKGMNTAGTEQVDVFAKGPEAQFHGETAHTAVTGASSSSTTTFGVLLGSVECTSASLDGTTAATEYTELTVKPTYSGCKGYGGREVTTHTNGCAYVLKSTGTGADGRVTIECPAGKSIETTIDKFPEGCTITIPAQTTGGVVDYKEEGSGTGRDLLLTWTLEGMKYVRDGCEVGGEGNNGTMSGSITLSGEDTSGNPKGIWLE